MERSLGVIKTIKAGTTGSPTRRENGKISTGDIYFPAEKKINFPSTLNSLARRLTFARFESPFSHSRSRKDLAIRARTRAFEFSRDRVAILIASSYTRPLARWLACVRNFTRRTRGRRTVKATVPRRRSPLGEKAVLRRFPIASSRSLDLTFARAAVASAPRRRGSGARARGEGATVQRGEFARY